MIPDPTPYADWFQIVVLFLALLFLIRPTGLYMASVFEGRVTTFSGLEKTLYALYGINPGMAMTATAYAKSLLVFTALGFLALFLVLVEQSFPEFSPVLAFNAAASFVTNTNWQPNAPETTTTTASQMAGLTVQNFLSAAAGLAVMAAFIRGLTSEKAGTVGNFWVDLTRSVLYILLPFSLVFALIYLSQGVVQSFGQTIPYHALESGAPQMLTTGPVASQIAIKMLGTNGGGYFTANAAHPFENPTPLSQFFQMLALMLLPASAPVCYGRMTGQMRQAKMILFVMFAILIPLTISAVHIEHTGNPLLADIGIDQTQGNMEGKEVRFGATGSALWASLTTAAASGSTNAAIDSFMPLGGMIPLVLIQSGEIIFGGTGSGLYGMLVYIMLTVFIAGLMIGRTPEYLGKKIGVFEIKMAALVILIPVVATLFGTGLAVMLPDGQAQTVNAGAQSFSEILYAFSSASNNNGSAMGGMNFNTDFYNIALGICMLLGRFGVMLPVLAIAGAMSRKIAVPASPGTLNTTSFLFALLLIGVIVLVGVLTYVPALTFGPIAEHLHVKAIG